MKFRRFMYATTVLALSTAPSSFKAQTLKSFGDWNLVCPPADQGATMPSCHLNQTFLHQKTGTVLLLITVVRQGSKKPPFLIFTTPLGINLPAGLLLRVDSRKAIELGFNTCTAEGCFAGYSLGLGLLKQFQRGRKAMATYQDGAKQNITCEVSLKGITKALEALK